MFFHKHTYNPDRAIAGITYVVTQLEQAVEQLQEDVAYLIEMLDERD